MAHRDSRDGKNMSLRTMPGVYDALVIFTAWISSRAYVYYYNWPYFLKENSDDSTFIMWYLPPEVIRENLAESLLYLRGEPPLPQLFLGILMKIAGWPLAFPVDSILLSIATLIIAFLMHSTIIRFGFRRIIATTIAAAWCIYPACLGVEVEAFPIAFYEALPGFLFMLALWFCLRIFDNNNNSKWLWLFGLTGAMLSMSRSTLSWIFLLPIFITLIIPGGKKKILAGCLAIIVQLLWSAKNFAMYDQFHLETASDVGQNIFSTIVNTGNFESFHAFSMSRHPGDVFVSEGLPCIIAGDIDCIEKYITPTKERDAALEEQISAKNGLYGESYFMHEISSRIKPLYADYLLNNPAIAFDMIARSYKLFWGNIYWQVSYIPGLDDDPLLLGINALMEKYKWFNIITIHSLGVAAFLLIAVKLIRRKPLSGMHVAFLYGALAFCYVAVVSSLGDHGENARYRVDVEPLVWLLPFMSYRCVSLFLAALRNDRQ